MPLIALTLVLVSALLHAAWNLIVKTDDDRLVAGWATVSAGAILGIPLLLAVGLPPARALGLLLASGVLHASYNIALARAYDHGDLSFVYPIARGVAPALATFGAVFVYGEVLSAAAFAGVGLVTLGVLLLGLLGRRVAVPGEAIAWSFLTAVYIGAYTLIDRQGIRLAAMDRQGLHLTSTVSYTVGLFWVNAPVVSLFTWWRRATPPWRLVGQGRWRTLALSGLFSMGAYLLVLLALSISRVGYIAALRETSVLVAAWLGWRRLGDLQGGARLGASAIVALGLALLVAFR